MTLFDDMRLLGDYTEIHNLEYSIKMVFRFSDLFGHVLHIVHNSKFCLNDISGLLVKSTSETECTVQ